MRWSCISIPLHRRDASKSLVCWLSNYEACLLDCTGLSQWVTCSALSHYWIIIRALLAQAQYYDSLWQIYKDESTTEVCNSFIRIFKGKCITQCGHLLCDNCIKMASLFLIPSRAPAKLFISLAEYICNISQCVNGVWNPTPRNLRASLRYSNVRAKCLLLPLMQCVHRNQN